MKVLVLLVVTGLMLVVRGHRIQTQPGFEAAKSLGVWYVIDFCGPPEELELRCFQSNFSAIPDTKYIQVVSQGVRPDGSIKVMEGNGTATDPNDQGRMEGTYDNEPLEVIAVNYDYDTYLTAVACTKAGKMSRVYIVSRTRQLEDQVRQDLKKKLQEQEVDISRLVAIDQSNCQE